MAESGRLADPLVANWPTNEVIVGRDGVTLPPPNLGWARIGHDDRKLIGRCSR